jgi:hypothetical protein
MAFSDHALVDHLKVFHGNSNMSDEQLQEISDHWFLKATPLERQQTLITLEATLDEPGTGATLRQRVPLVQLNRRLSAIAANLERLGR